MNECTLGRKKERLDTRRPGAFSKGEGRKNKNNKINDHLKVVFSKLLCAQLIICRGRGLPLWVVGLVLDAVVLHSFGRGWVPRSLVQY